MELGENGLGIDESGWRRGEAGLRGTGFAGFGGLAAEFFVVAFALCHGFGCGSELGVEGFDRGFAFEDGFFVVA